MTAPLLDSLREGVDTRLANGLRVLIVEASNIPLVHFAWIAPAGSRHDPRGLEGLASLTWPLLRAGTESMGGREIDAQTEDLGADIVPRVSWDSGRLALELLDEDWRFGLELGWELLRRPLLPERDLEMHRRQRLRTIERARRDPSAQSRDALLRRFFGDSARARNLFGNPASLECIRRRDVVAFHSRRFCPSGMTLVCLGSLRPPAVLEHLASMPMEPRSKGDLAEAGESVAAPDLPSLEHLEIADASAAEATLGFSIPTADEGQILEAELLTNILGTRLRSALRERCGASYHVNSSLFVRGDLGLLTLVAKVDPENLALAFDQMRGEAEGLAAGRLSAAELRLAKTVVEVETWRSFQRLPSAASALERLARSGPVLSAFEGLAERLASTTARELEDLAARVLCLERAGFVSASSGVPPSLRRVS
ncbi:MAG: pitrilysin family protein [Acidobacteriota bacterium]